MKKKHHILIMFFFFISCGLATQNQKIKYEIRKAQVKPLSQIGEVNLEAIARTKGQWIIEDSRFVLEFSDRYACRIDGLKYFFYKRVGSRSRYPYIYTIVKSHLTNHNFFARGYYKDGRLIGSTSRLEFNRDQMIVYSDKDPQKVYFKALRIKK